ncbi:MAG: hypothetical protein OXU81_07335 [Gammaproteobacteria bacterium]|nr:hypothetical protein [Gammaproteobacteria bacterium]
MTETVWDGWRVARWDRRLVHLEADDAEDAIRGSIEALRGLGDRTESPHELRAFRTPRWGSTQGPRDFTRAVIEGHRRGKGGRAGQ